MNDSEMNVAKRQLCVYCIIFNSKINPLKVASRTSLSGLTIRMKETELYDRTIGKTQVENYMLTALMLI